MKVYSVVYAAFEANDCDLYVDTHVFTKIGKAKDFFKSQKKDIEKAFSSYYTDEDEDDVFSMADENDTSKISVTMFVNETDDISDMP